MCKFYGHHVLLRYFYQTLNMSFVPLTGFFLWPVLSRFVSDDLFSQLLIANSIAGWMMAISAFGLTTRGVTTIATSPDPTTSLHRFFVLNVIFAIVLVPGALLFLTAQATPFPLIIVLLLYVLFAPTQLDWADHGHNNYRRPFLKNAAARSVSICLVGLAVVLDMTAAVVLSAALLFPQIVANCVTYRSYLRTIFERGFQKVEIANTIRLLFWPGLQRVTTSTYANLDVLLVPLFFTAAQGVALLYIYRLLKALLGLMLGGVTSFLPQLAKYVLDPKSVTNALPLGFIFGVVSACGLLLTAFFFLFTTQILQALGANDMEYAQGVMTILCFAIFPMTMNNLVVNTVLYPRKKEGLVMISSSVVIAVTVIWFPYCETILDAAQLFLVAECGLLIFNSLLAWRVK